MKKHGIIFDLDGTLWNTAETIVPCWNEVLIRHGQQPITKEDMSSFMGKTGDVIAEMMMPSLDIEEARAIFSECCREEQTLLSENGGILYPELESTLNILCKNYHMSIVSNCHTGYLQAFFNAHDLKNYFDDCECHGGTGLSKAENIRLIIERNQLEKAVYVGDTELDRSSADEAGIPFIYASYGFGNITDAEYRIDEIADLPSLLRKLSF